MTSRRYCVISPCRDEARYARRTLASVVHQSQPPARWVIVDDGSKDETPAILAEYAARFPWIRVLRRPDRGHRKVGGGVIDAFYAGLQTIDPGEFPYLCKLDMDLDLPPRYFELLMDRMEADPRIGTCSGKAYFFSPPARDTDVRFPLTPGAHLFSERIADDHSVGGSKFYRTACFRQIGGFVREVMWDGIDGHRCRQLGWRALSWDDPDLRFVHLRPMGTSDRSWWRGRVRHGSGQYFMGTMPVWMVASAAFRMTRPPYVVGGLGILYGYFRSMLGRAPRYGDHDFRTFLRRYQWACLAKGRSRALAAIDARQAAFWSPPDRNAEPGRDRSGPAASPDEGARASREFPTRSVT